MTHLAPPKIMNWTASLDQHYQTDKKILVTSGGSFTASTTQLDCAASWPGFVYDRCRFDHVVDLSWPGVGNDYVADSIILFFEDLPAVELSKYLVVVMWSGIGWAEKKIINDSKPPIIKNVSYHRIADVPGAADYITDSQNSYNRILETYQYLQDRNISFAFTNYANTLFPPCLPRNDLTCNFVDHLNKQQIEELRKLPWIPTNSKNYLYDYAFFNNFDEDYHPPVECNMEWTDKVLLPSLCEQGLIKNK